MKSDENAEAFYLVVLHIARLLKEVDLALGISTARFSSLASLQFHGTTNIGELAADENVSRPNMTRLVRDMAKAGLVATEPDPRDGRGVLVRITGQGRRLVKRSRDRKIAMVQDLLGKLETDRRGDLQRAVLMLAPIVWTE